MCAKSQSDSEFVKLLLFKVAVLVLVALTTAGKVAAQTCPSWALTIPKEQTLYLFFPTSSSSVTVGGTTYNIGDFDVSDLDGTIGTTTQLRNRIFEILRDSYCEFNVDVKQVTSTPSPSETRWQIVGIGTDVGSGSFGRSYVVDTGDNEGQDFARVWADQFDVDYGASGGALDGTNSTLERWGTTIGSTVAHEAAHNYGLVHENADPRAGTSEDATLNHVMATGLDFGSTKFERGDNRAKRIRHFSDISFEILGHNISLNNKTLSNWDFVNPNNSDATQLKITLLSKASSISIGWVYSGNMSPWTDNLTLTKLTGTQTFHDETYNIYELTLSTAKAWSGGAAGTVPPGGKFHVGVAASETILVYEVTLMNGSGDLPLKPRMIGYDSGTAGADGDGDFDVDFFNPNPDDGDLELRDIEIIFLPRTIDINNMILGGELISREGLPVTPFPRQPGGWDEAISPRLSENAAVLPLPRQSDDLVTMRRDKLAKGGFYSWWPKTVIRNYIKMLTLGEKPVSVPVARLSDKRHVDLYHDAPSDCVPGMQTPEGFIPFENDADIDVGEVIHCAKGPGLSLFPATYTYVKATVVDPNAEYWDPAQDRFVTGPLESHLFYQFAGIVPDLNANGTDDLLDIRQGVSRDANINGLPDEVEPFFRFAAVRLRVGEALSNMSTLDPGFSANLSLEYYMAPNFTIEGVLGYQKLTDNGYGSDLEIGQITLNGRTYLPLAGPRKPFANVGAGAYFQNPGSTEFGYNVGAGLDYTIRPHLALEAVYQYHDVVPGNSGFEFSTIQIGIRFGF